MLDYSGVQELVKFSVEYYDKFSIIEMNEDHQNFLYFPHYNSVINVNGYNDSSNHLLNTLEELNPISDNNGKDEYQESLYCLVTEPLIRFTITNNLSLNNDDDFDDFDSHHIYNIYEDIKNNDRLYNLSHGKKSIFYITAVLDHTWTQGYDDSDCEITYIGIIENISISNLIKPSTDRIEQSIEYNKKMDEEYMSRYVEEMEEDGFLF